MCWVQGGKPLSGEVLSHQLLAICGDEQKKICLNSHSKFCHSFNRVEKKSALNYGEAGGGSEQKRLEKNVKTTKYSLELFSSIRRRTTNAEWSSLTENTRS